MDRFKFAADFRIIHSGNYYKKAFTLAEVLITLGIIGVVAAMTLPSLINNIQSKQLEAGLKKQYSIISQVFDYMYVNDMCTTTDCLTGTDIYNNFGKFVKNIKKCNINNPDTRICFEKSRDHNYWDYSKSWNYIVTDVIDDGQFVLPDGALISFNVYTGTVVVATDVNGKLKRPNALGHDVFLFQVLNKGNRGVLVPMGAEGTIYQDSSQYCTTTGRTTAYNGLGCTYKALSEPDYFKNLP